MRIAAALAWVVIGCGGDPQADVAKLCEAAGQVCPDEGCGDTDSLAERWSRSLGRISMSSEAGRQVRTAAYAAEPGQVDDAVRGAAVAAGLSWDCAAMTRLDGALRGAGSRVAPLLGELKELFGGGRSPDAVVTALSHYLTEHGDDPRVDAIAKAMGDAEPHPGDAEDAVAAKALGAALAALCERSPDSCGGAAQVCVTLLTRLAPRNAEGRSLLATKSGFPLLLDKAIDIVDDPSALRTRLKGVPSPGVARMQALFDGILKPVLGDEG